MIRSILQRFRNFLRRLEKCCPGQILSPSEAGCLHAPRRTWDRGAEEGRQGLSEWGGPDSPRRPVDAVDSGGGRGHHGQNRGELSAFKNNVGLQTGASAGGEGVFAEAVAFFKQEKRIVLDLFQVNSGQRRETVIHWKDNVESFAKEFMRQTMRGWDR